VSLGAIESVMVEDIDNSMLGSPVGLSIIDMMGDVDVPKEGSGPTFLPTTEIIFSFLDMMTALLRPVTILSPQ